MRLTTNVIFTLSTLIACAPSHAQIFKFTREEMIKYTANNPFERFEDGRPKAPDALLEKVKDLSAEEVLAVLPGAKFPNQYEGNWQIMHPEKKLIGRAVTVQFMPYRPDLMEVTEADAKARGSAARPNTNASSTHRSPATSLWSTCLGRSSRVPSWEITSPPQSSPPPRTEAL
jgi:hypothetical protein